MNDTGPGEAVFLLVIGFYVASFIANTILGNPYL